MLPASIAAHVIAGFGIVAVQTWDVNFPLVPPATVEPYRILVALAVPPPPPPPPAAAAPARASEPLEKLPDNVAPEVIPDVVPETLPLPVAASEGAIGGVEGGIEGGEVGGMIGGTEGGVMPPGPPPPPPDTIVVPRDEKLPLKAVSMNYPIYPDKWRYRNIEDSLVLRYRIDKKGRVVEVVLLRPPRFPEFAEAAISAVRSWRFRPLTINGEPKEVLHELTVNFRIERPQARPAKPVDRPSGGRPGDGPEAPVPPPGGEGSPRAPGDGTGPGGPKRP
jgi:protein TonB